MRLTIHQINDVIHANIFKVQKSQIDVPEGIYGSIIELESEDIMKKLYGSEYGAATKK